MRPIKIDHDVVFHSSTQLYSFVLRVTLSFTTPGFKTAGGDVAWAYARFTGKCCMLCVCSVYCGNVVWAYGFW